MTAKHFAIFDHTEKRDGQDPKAWWEGRIKIARMADAAGWHGVQVAEHHSTPLGFAPAPPLILTALAQHTENLRVGALAFVLPFYHPMRLIEELTMIDNMSGGRLDVGVARGISPFELATHGIPSFDSKTRFNEALQVLIQGLREQYVDFNGEHFKIVNAPIAIEPTQKPNPPMWFGITRPDNAQWSGDRGMNVVSFNPNFMLTELFDIHAEARDKARGSDLDFNPGVATPMQGAVRHVFVAETDEKAMEIAKPAYEKFYQNMVKLWQDNSSSPAFYTPDLAVALSMDMAIVGSPSTVKEQLQRYFDETGANYAALGMSWGGLSQQQVEDSMSLFNGEVLPAFK